MDQQHCCLLACYYPTPRGTPQCADDCPTQQELISAYFVSKKGAKLERHYEMLVSLDNNERYKPPLRNPYRWLRHHRHMKIGNVILTAEELHNFILDEEALNEKKLKNNNGMKKAREEEDLAKTS
ncbi:hypothetical protein Tco_0245895 [Tanacetum coccineum]